MSHQVIDVDANDVRHVAFLVEKELERKGISVGMGMLGSGLVAGRLGSPHTELTMEEEMDFVNELSHFITAYWAPVSQSQ